jgi:hypothetical protein
MLQVTIKQSNNQTIKQSSKNANDKIFITKGISASISE